MSKKDKGAIAEVTSEVKTPMVAKVRKPAQINGDKDYAVESQVADVQTLVNSLQTAGFTCTAGATNTEVAVNGCLVRYEYFYNSAIKREEWKAKIYKDDKSLTHYKIQNASKIIKFLQSH